MGDRPAVTYGLKFQARALAAVTTEKQYSRWLVGTNALREDNEVVEAVQNHLETCQ